MTSPAKPEVQPRELVHAIQRFGDTYGVPTGELCDAAHDLYEAHASELAHLREVHAREVAELRDLICRAAPLAWVANDDMDGAKAWEKEAHALLNPHAIGGKVKP